MDYLRSEVTCLQWLAMKFFSLWLDAAQALHVISMPYPICASRKQFPGAEHLGEMGVKNQASMCVRGENDFAALSHNEWAINVTHSFFKSQFIEEHWFQFQMRAHGMPMQIDHLQHLALQTLDQLKGLKCKDFMQVSIFRIRYLQLPGFRNLNARGLR